MGIILPCTSPCELSNETVSDQSTHLSLLSSSNSSISSQPSLPSVPSLNPPSPPLGQIQSLKTTTENIATLSGHSSYVFSLALNGNHLYSGCYNGEIHRWNNNNHSSSDGEFRLRRLNGDIVAKSQSAVKSITFLGDNKLITAHHDHKIRVWKILEDHKTAHKKFKCIAALPTLKDSCIKLFSAKNYVEVRRHKKCTWVHHVDTVSALALTKDGSLLYSVSWDRTFKVWRTSDFKCLESVNAHNDAINAIALSNDDGYVYTGSADKTIKIWKKETATNKQKKSYKHRLVATLEKHKSAVNALALNVDASLLYSGACDRSIIVWGKDGGDGKLTVIGALRGHRKAILCLSVVDNLVCSGSADKTVRIWRRDQIGNSHSCLSVLEGHNGPIKCLAAASENDAENRERSYFIYSGSLDCNIKVWKMSVLSV